MRIVKFSGTVGLLLLTGPSLIADPPESKNRPAVKEQLTPATYSKFQALIRPQEHEWRHLKVRWITDIVAARKKAAAEDKPIIVLRTGGAGYNDPLGAC
jgi:hypothetical protein